MHTAHRTPSLKVAFLILVLLVSSKSFAQVITCGGISVSTACLKSPNQTYQCTDGNLS